MGKLAADRVFCIDDECYIIYIGSEKGDYRPFIRIGTSANLPDRLKSVISWVIVSDNFTGDFLREHENVQLPLSGETTYTGDQALVARLKQFLHEKTLPAAKIIYDTSEAKDVKGSFVYFHVDGNLHVTLNSRTLFDLRERESADNHFVHQVERAARIVRDNPFRYQKTLLNSPGFVLGGGRLHLFGAGSLGAAGVDPNYAAHLCGCGLDPDSLDWVLTDGLSQGLQNRLKRCALKRQNLSLAAPNPEKLRSAVQFFLGKDSALVPLRPGQEERLGGFQVLPGPGPGLAGLKILYNGRPLAVMNEALTPVPGLLPRDLSLPEGLPVVLEASLPPVSGLLRRFLTDFLAAVEDCLDQPEAKAAAALVAAFERAGPAGTGLNGAALEADLGRLERRAVSGGAWFLWWNLRELCRILLLSTQNQTLRVGRALKRAEVSLSGLIAAAAPAMHWPVVGELFQDGTRPVLLFRCTLQLSRQKELQARRAGEAAARLLPPDRTEFFLLERERLLALVDRLVSPAGAKATEAQRPLAPAAPVSAVPGSGGRPSSRPQEVKPAGPREGAAAGGPSPVEAGRKGGPTREGLPPAARWGLGRKEKAAAGRPGGRGMWLVAALVLVVVAAGGLLVFLIPSLGRQLGEIFRFGGDGTTMLRPQDQQGPVSREPPSLPGEQAAGEAQAEPQTPGTEDGPGGETTQGPAVQEPVGPGPSPAVTPAEGPGPAGGNQASAKTTEAPADQPDAPAATQAPQPPGQPGPNAFQPGPAQGPGTQGTQPAQAREPERQVPADPQRPRITVLDIYLLVNKIAVKNAYLPLTGLDEVGQDRSKDPNWIYPGNQFTLPDDTVYTVVREDTLWGIATTFILREHEKHYRAYLDALARYEGPGLADTLERLAETTYSENFRRFLQGKVRTLRGKEE